MFLYTILSKNSSISQHKRVTFRTNMQETDINFIKKIKGKLLLIRIFLFTMKQQKGQKRGIDEQNLLEAKEAKKYNFVPNDYR